MPERSTKLFEFVSVAVQFATTSAKNPTTFDFVLFY